jgi:hypothetical protein
MNSVKILKSTQLRQLFKIFQTRCMQSLKIFAAWEGFLFEFASLSGVWKFENYLTGPGPHVSDPFPFDRPGRSPSPVRRPSSWGPPVVATPRGLPPPPLSLLWTSLRKPPPTPLFPSQCSATLLAALHQPPLCPPWPVADEPCPSCPIGPKGASRHGAPPVPKACSQRRLAKPGHRIFSTVIFLREHLAGGSLLRLFPHPDDPAASSMPQRSSSPTPFLASPPRFSCSCMTAEVQWPFPLGLFEIFAIVESVVSSPPCRAWWLRVMRALATPSSRGSGAGPRPVSPVWPWAELRPMWIVGFVNFF